MGTVIYFLPYFLLVFVAIAGTVCPIPDWNIYFKIIMTILIFSLFAAHIMFNIFVLILMVVALFETLRAKSLIIIGGIISLWVLILCLIAPFIWTNKIKVTEVSISSAKIPTAFDGYKIIHLSDIHADYLINDKLINKAIDIINKENADLLLITGDFITYKSSEIKRIIGSLINLRLKDEIYVVLGNHDYGTYYRWKNDDLKRVNFEELLSYFGELNWNLLRNEHVYLTRNNDTLVLVGTEHYSRKKSHYPSPANINLALQDVPESLPKICLTHNPDYWVDSLRYLDNSIFLTLSGHTHGMQIGIHGNPNLNMYRIKNQFTAGLYEHKNRYLYINTGFGTVGFPFRVGLKPEITVVGLKTF